ncbi:hypothetical protein [Streptomyces sp. NPDC047000]|uniref:hypothetical protein n=1 Tax=Streptomyces sp. NPDC047000 TaxID=3155474 RepID=UPI0033C19606
MSDRKRVGLALTSAVVGAVLALASCTTHKQQDPPVVADGEHKSPPTEPSPTPSFTPPSVKSLPQHAILGRNGPRLGKVTTMSKGYTAKAFLDHISTTWNITLKAPKREELPLNRKVLVATGISPKGRSVQTFLSDDLDLSSLICSTPIDDQQGDSFLRDCAAIDVPGVDQDAAAKWFTEAEKEDDALYAKKKESVISGAFASGPVVMFLDRTSDKHALRVLGGAVAENS